MHVGGCFHCFISFSDPDSFIYKGLCDVSRPAWGLLGFCNRARQNPCSDICPSTGVRLGPLSCHTEVRYFNSLVVESPCVHKAWLVCQEKLGQAKDLPRGLADCKVSALDNLTCWTSQMAQECWTLGFFGAFLLVDKGAMRDWVINQSWKGCVAFLKFIGDRRVPVLCHF